MSVNALTQRHRAQQLLIRRDTAAKVARLWPALDFEALDKTYPVLADRLATVVAANRRTSAGMAAQYLRTFRRAAGVRGDVRIVVPQRLPAEQFSTSLRVTSLVAVKAATAAGTAADVAMGNALTLTSGAMTRLVLDAGRQTVTGTLAHDPAARGYTRVLGGGGCEFCQMLAGRGGVYSAESADFQAHDHCGCTAEPAY